MELFVELSGFFTALQVAQGTQSPLCDRLAVAGVKLGECVGEFGTVERVAQRFG